MNEDLKQKLEPLPNGLEALEVQCCLLARMDMLHLDKFLCRLSPVRLPSAWKVPLQKWLRMVCTGQYNMHQLMGRRSCSAMLETGQRP